MDAQTVETLVREAIADARVTVDGVGANYNITVVSDVFSGPSPVKRQQTVYAALGESIASGAIHAVSIRTFTEQEWEGAGA